MIHLTTVTRKVVKWAKLHCLATEILAKLSSLVKDYLNLSLAVYIIQKSSDMSLYNFGRTAEWIFILLPGLPLGYIFISKRFLSAENQNMSHNNCGFLVLHSAFSSTVHALMGGVVTWWASSPKWYLQCGTRLLPFPLFAASTKMCHGIVVQWKTYMPACGSPIFHHPHFILQLCWTIRNIN